jgi:hypothetical protein
VPSEQILARLRELVPAQGTPAGLELLELPASCFIGRDPNDPNSQDPTLEQIEAMSKEVDRLFAGYHMEPIGHTFSLVNARPFQVEKTEDLFRILCRMNVDPNVVKAWNFVKDAGGYLVLVCGVESKAILDSVLLQHTISRAFSPLVQAPWRARSQARRRRA